MKIQWPENEMAVQLTQHAAERSTHRDDSPFKVTKQTIQDIVDSAEDKIINFGQQYRTLVLKTQNAINIIGTLSKSAGDWVFRIITVMVKPDFHARPEDKVVYVNEMKSFKQLIEYVEKVSGGYRVKSHQTGKNFGTYPTRAKAEKRLAQIHRFTEIEQTPSNDDSQVLKSELVKLRNSPFLTKEIIDRIEEIERELSALKVPYEKEVGWSKPKVKVRHSNRVTNFSRNR